MNKIIEYYQNQIYGKNLLYIKDNKTEQIIRNLIGKKTISQVDISNLQLLGLKFELVLKPIN